MLSILLKLIREVAVILHLVHKLLPTDLLIPVSPEPLVLVEIALEPLSLSH
jgi:hypothetical protein